jgi:hypothetical protein
MGRRARKSKLMKSSRADSARKNTLKIIKI